MALPVNPTKTTICTEALDKAGEDSSAGTLLTRAEDKWLEEIKNDIWTRSSIAGNTRLKTLQTFDIQISVLGQSKYAFPSDFDEEISVEILDGTHTGTAQAGANTSITLESGEDITEDTIKGQYILITGGTGVNGLRQCTAYNTTTLVATVDSAWDTNPDATSVYLVVDNFKTLDEGNINDLNDATNRTTRAKPGNFYKIHEGVNVRFIFDYPADKSTYGIRVRYYSHLNKVDLAEGSTLISTIYLNWHSLLVQGVFWKSLENMEDDPKRIVLEKAEYERFVANMIAKEIPYGGEFEGFTV